MATIAANNQVELLLHLSDIQTTTAKWNWSGSHMHTSQTLREPSPVLLSTSRCSQAPLVLCNMLSDSARVFTGGSESTCSHEGAFRMLWDLTTRIVKFWSYWNLHAELWECSRELEISAQVSRRPQGQLRPLRKLCARLGTIFSQYWFIGFHNHKVYCVLYSAVLKLQDLLHHIMACIIEVSLYTHTRIYRDNEDGLIEWE